MEIEEREYQRSTNSTEYSYYYNNEFEYFIVSTKDYEPITSNDKKIVGYKFISFLNSKDSYFNFFENYLKKLNKCKNIHEVHFLNNSIIDEMNEIKNNWITNEKYLLIYSLEKFAVEILEEYSDREVKEKIKELKNELKINKDLLNPNSEKNIIALSKEVGAVKKEIIRTIERKEKELDTLKNDLDNHMVKEYKKKVSKHFNDIKSIINNICNYLNEEDSKNKDNIRTYLLWGVSLPQLKRHMYQEEKELDMAFIGGHYGFYYYEDKNILWKLKPIKEYRISSLIEFLDIFVDLYFEGKFTINICKNCGKYFIPNKKSDEKYCDFEYKEKLTCKEYAPLHRFKNDKVNKKHETLDSRYRSKISHSKNNPIQNKIYKDERKTFNEKYKDYKKKLKENRITEKEVLKWLDTQIKEYEKKYFKK